MENTIKKKNFHHARWDEDIIYNLSQPGERGILIPETCEGIREVVGETVNLIPASMMRTEAPALPELSQMRVLKHFLRLSQETLGADLNIDIGQGTCTMKYSPKVNEKFATSHKFTSLHPDQPAETVQGILEVYSKMEDVLKGISGLDRFSFQPSGGSQAILAMASIVQKYHESKGEGDQRDEIITTIFSHPSDAAAAAVKGYKIITLYQNENGIPDIDALKAAVSERTAALFITNPEDTGIYNPHIEEFTKIIHENGALCGYDQANANGIMGITRAKEAGFDISFFNLHKTFSSPHGCGGPATGAIGVTAELAKYLPKPLVGFDGTKYTIENDMPHSIGKVRDYFGVAPVVLKAYAWVKSLGEEGIREVSKVAVLNNNYVLSKIRNIRGVEIPFKTGPYKIEQVRYSWEKLYQETGVSIENIAYRMADFGMHLWSSHHPFIVPQPFTVEPTEAYSKAEMDEYIAALTHIAHEAYTNPEIVLSAPHNSVVHKINDEPLDDPAKWAITWRAYNKKWDKKIR